MAGNELSNILPTREKSHHDVKEEIFHWNTVYRSTQLRKPHEGAEKTLKSQRNHVVCPKGFTLLLTHFRGVRPLRKISRLQY